MHMPARCIRSSTRPLKPIEFHKDGYYGDGVTVALIDSGVVPVDGLDASGKVINGLDVSFESQSDELRYMDTFGHGTHLAGIIAGYDSSTGFMGIAPGANILNVKVADMKVPSMSHR